MTNEYNSNEMEIDVVKLLLNLWEHIWTIVICGAILALLLFIYSKVFVKPTYKADILVYVNNDQEVSGQKSQISSADLSAGKSLVDTYIVILKSRTALGQVLEESGLDEKYNTVKLSKMVSADAVNNTGCMKVTVETTDAEESRILANGIADVLPEVIPNAIAGSSVRIVDRAVTPTQKASPNIKKYVAIGFLLGAVACCAVLIIADFCDDSIRDESYIVDNFKAPVLAVIPDLTQETSGKKYYKKQYGYYR